MMNLGLVVAQFNASVTEQMAEAATDAAADRGVELTSTVRVPGVYDTPLAADRLARQDGVDAVTVVGAVVTGDTDHDQTIADATAESLQEVGLERDTPVTFGVTGPGQSGAEARERVEKGAAAVDAAVDLVEALP
ncbi:MAG: 6,7-dimethyl-8-ribityllumazine synthase [Halolamina sp.]|uniref:6,7-dimethyl-8-ribityllumazine synthase n=1 Tax=Halolamina sp. TaxID=1940283 RepID=UPI002FC3429A